MEPLALGADLYALEPEEFTAARNALVKQLRSQGLKDDAAVVAGFRRPPATAWALNALARDHPQLVQAVLDAGQTLRAAMERAVHGDASTLRDAQLAERRSIDAVTAAAVARLEATGRVVGDTPRRRLAATLRAAVVDQTVAKALVAGMLDSDHDAAGFGWESLADPAEAQQRDGRPRASSSKNKAEATTPARTGTTGQRSRSKRASEELVLGSSTANGEAERPDEKRARQQRLDAEADEAEQRAHTTERAATAAEQRARDMWAAATAAAEEAETAIRRARDLEDQATAAQGRAIQERQEAKEAAAQAASARKRAGGHN